MRPSLQCNVKLALGCLGQKWLRMKSLCSYKFLLPTNNVQCIEKIVVSSVSVLIAPWSCICWAGTQLLNQPKGHLGTEKKECCPLLLFPAPMHRSITTTTHPRQAALLLLPQHCALGICWMLLLSQTSWLPRKSDQLAVATSAVSHLRESTRMDGLHQHASGMQPPITWTFLTQGLSVILSFVFIIVLHCYSSCAGCQFVVQITSYCC